VSKAKMTELLKETLSGGPAPSDSGMSRFISEIGAELKHLGAQGSHEMAAALFRGDAFVMYPHAGQESVEQENPGHGLHGPAQPEQDRGLEM
jgi:hypothetical protein